MSKTISIQFINIVFSEETKQRRKLLQKNVQRFGAGAGVQTVISRIKLRVSNILFLNHELFPV